MAVEQITLEPGFIVVTNDRGRRHQIAIADVLRAGDIPVLTIGKLTLLTDLAQVVTVIVKTLIEQEILDEKLVEGYDLQYVAEQLVDTLGADW